MTQTDNLTTPSRGLPELGRYVLKLNSATRAEERPGIVLIHCYEPGLASLYCKSLRLCGVMHGFSCGNLHWRVVCWAVAAG